MCIVVCVISIATKYSSTTKTGLNLEWPFDFLFCITIKIDKKRNYTIHVIHISTKRKIIYV